MPDPGGVISRTPVLTSQVASGSADQTDPPVSGVDCAITGIFFKGATAGDIISITDRDDNEVFGHTLRAAGEFFLDLPHPIYSLGIKVDITVTSSGVWSLSYRELA